MGKGLIISGGRLFIFFVMVFWIDRFNVRRARYKLI